MFLKVKSVTMYVYMNLLSYCFIIILHSFYQDGVSDIYVSGLYERNRALNADVVAVQLKPIEEWRVSCNHSNVFIRVKTYRYIFTLETKGHKLT